MIGSLNFNGVVKGLVAAGCLGLAANASAATVSFANFDDNDGPTIGYDADATAAGAGGSNVLDLVVSSFTADSSGTFGAIAFDQIAFDVMAPAGYYITGFSVFEEVDTNTESTGSVTGASLSIDVNGASYSLGQGIFSGGSGTTTSIISNTGIIDIPKTMHLDVSIDNNLFAANGGVISKGASSIEFQVAPVPLPPAVWLLGSAILGLATIRRTSKHRA